MKNSIPLDQINMSFHLRARKHFYYCLKIRRYREKKTEKKTKKSVAYSKI